MHTSDIFYTQGIAGFYVKCTQFLSGVVRVILKKSSSKASSCAVCGSMNVKTRQQGIRQIKGLRTGSKHVIFDVPIIRTDCLDCEKSCREELPFVNKWARQTKAVERTVVELRPEMSISAVADWLGLDRRTVKLSPSFP